MKTASTIARYLLGLIFLTFGLNGFFHFIPQPPPTGLALQFFIAGVGIALHRSHFRGARSSALCSCSSTATCRSPWLCSPPSSSTFSSSTSPWRPAACRSHSS